MCTSFIYLLYLYVCSVHMGALLCKNMERPKVDIRHLPQLFSTSFIDLGTLCWIQTLPVRIVQVSSSAFPWDTCLLVLHARITGRSPHSPVYMGSGHLSVLESSCFHSPWSSSGLFFSCFCSYCCHLFWGGVMIHSSGWFSVDLLIFKIWVWGAKCEPTCWSDKYLFSLSLKPYLSNIECVDIYVIFNLGLKSESLQ